MAFNWGLLSQKGLYSIAASLARINIWEGAVRSSKTICSILRWLEYIKTGPAGDLVMIGKTERTLKRNILDVIESIVGKKNYKLKQGSGEVFIYGRRIYIVGANDARAEQKIRGGTFAGAYVDEITILPEDFWSMLLSRLSVKGAKCFGTTNPDNPYHWLKEKFIDREGELNCRVFHFELADNPNLDEEYVEALKKEYTGLWYKRFILGLWVMAEGAIYDCWDEEKHLKELRFEFNNYAVAVDYGTANPCTFGLYGYGARRGEYHDKVGLLREYYWDSRAKGRQKSDEEYCNDFEAWLTMECGGIVPEVVYVDPSAASFIVALRKRGYNVKEANNDVLDGIRYTHSIIANNAFWVDPSCVATKKEFAGYVWDAKSQEKGIDEPMKMNDHAMDRNRYFLYTHFGQFQNWTGYSDVL